MKVSKNTEKNKEVSEDTLAKKIWNQIKNTRLELFGLPNQFVYLHCTPMFLDDNKLFMTIGAGSVLTSLEAALSPKYKVEMADKFVIVSLA